MNHPSRPRNRKPVTYGSSSRRQSIVKNAPESDSTVSSSRMTPSSSRLSKSGIPGNEIVDKRPRTPGRTKTAAVTESHQDTVHDIYDIPSSDDESQNLILRRKRRRAIGGLQNSTSTSTSTSTSIGIGTLRQDPSSTAKEVAKQNGNGGLSRMMKENHTEIAPPTAKAIPQDRKRAPRQKWETETQQQQQQQQPSPKKPKTISTIAKNSKSVSCSEDEMQTVVQSKHNSPAKKSDSGPSAKSPRSPSSRQNMKSTTRATTPGRRRLIDALGKRERSIDRELSIDSTDSQLSSPIATQSPIRPRDTDTGRLGISTDSQRDGFAAEATTAPSPHFLGSKVTYARQRSFLDDLDLTGGLSAGLEETDPFSPKGLSDSLPRARLFHIDDITNDEGTVRSIHELRQAGGNARYKSAIESIFEDIEDTQISVSGRCNALAQICGKLLDPKQARQFVECGFDKRIVDCFSRDLDVVSTTLAFSAFGLISVGRPLPYIIANAAWPNMLKGVSLLIALQDDISTIVRARQNNLSKATQNVVMDIAPKIKATLFGDVDVPKFSPCLLALLCLKVTIVAFQEKGENPSGLSTNLLRQLVDLLLSTCSPENKQPLGKSQVLILGLVVLEAHTTSSSVYREEYCDVLQSLPALHGLLQIPDDSDEVGQEVQSLYIRVILNVTNSSADLCDSYATPPLIEALTEIVMSKFNGMNGDSLSQPEGISSLDTVILTLGALINLTEQSAKSRIMFLNTTRGSVSILDQLLRLFLEHVESTAQADSVPEVHHNVAVGYLAVLLLSLCLDIEVRLQIKKILHPKGLSVVMSTVDEFMQYHQKIEQELHPMQNPNETGGFLGRLQDLVGQIQFIEG